MKTPIGDIDSDSRYEYSNRKMLSGGAPSAMANILCACAEGSGLGTHCQNRHEGGVGPAGAARPGLRGDPPVPYRK